MQDVKQDASGLPSGQGSQQSEHEQLLRALTAQTDAINRLAASNEALVQAMAEADDIDTDEVPRTVGLNGRPL